MTDPNLIESCVIAKALRDPRWVNHVAPGGAAGPGMVATTGAAIVPGSKEK